MNFSALNTHAIGVQSTVSASAEVHEGAGSFSTGASVSAQAILHSHAVASAINSVALTTTQSVVRFARATASVGCSAAANVDGHRVKFSNAEIVCAANSAANAIVTHQAVASVAALGSVVALGSRVAFATASLQADARFTANSGGVIFVSATGITASAVCSSAASIESNAAANATAQAEVNSSAHCLRDLAATVTASSTLSSSSHVISRASGVFTGSSLAISVGEKRAVAHTTIVASAQVSADGSTGLFVSAQFNAQAIISVASNVTHSVNASVIASSSISKSDTQTLIVTAAGGNLVIDGQSNKSLTLKSGSTYTFDLSDSSLSSHPLRFSTTSNGTHGGGTVFRGIINGVTVTGTQGQAGSFISLTVSDSTPASLYYFCLYHSGMGGAISVVSAADVSAEIFSHANASITGTALVSTSPNIDHFVSSSVIASSSVDSSASRIIDVSASVSGFALSISVGNKISVGHAQFTASATATSVCITKSSAEANASCSSQSSATASKVASGEAQVTASAIVSASSGSVVDASAGITCTAQTNGSAGNYIDVSASISSFAVSISAGNKISNGNAQFNGTASVSAVARNDSSAQATAACNASVASSAIAETPVQAIALVSDQYTTVAAYTSYHYTTATSVYGYYTPVPSFQSRTNPGGVTYYYSGNYYYHFGMWPAGSDYTWTFLPQYQNSSAPTEYSTWGSFGPAPAANTSGRYKGAVIGSINHQDSVYIPGLNQVTVTHYATRYQILEDTVTTHTTTHPAVYVEAVSVPTGYTPNAQVVVSDVSVLSGSFAYSTASAEVTATGTRVCIGIADVTSAASATSTAFTVRYIDASATVNATADLSLSVTVDILGSAQVLADAEATAESFNTLLATGSFSGSSLAISVGNKKAVGQTDIVATASVSVASSTYVIFDASAAINPSVTISAVGDLTIITAGLSTATATASIVASGYLSESVASASVNASASATADGDNLIGAVANVITTQFYTESVFHPAVITAGYWVPAVWEWAVVGSTVYVNGSYSYGPVGSGYRFVYPGTTSYQGSDTYLTYATEQYTQTAATYYVNPVTVSEAYTTPAFWTNTGYTPSANVAAEATVLFSFSLTASSELSATAGAIQTASAQISASADTTAASYIESSATCTLNGTGSISPVNTNFLKFTSAALSASSDVVSLADKEIYAKADVVGTADITVSGTGINAAFGYSNAAASVEATAFRMRVPSPINAIATAEVVSSFTYVSQTGERSNGILILVEAEVRSITVEAIDRVIIVDAEDRTIFAEAA